jgi:hypothetical protein
VIKKEEAQILQQQNSFFKASVEYLQAQGFKDFDQESPLVYCLKTRLFMY